MKNLKLHWLITEQREAGRAKWTVSKIAEAIYSGRPHVNQVLNNKPGRGGRTRRKLAAFFRKEYPGTWREILEALGWEKPKTQNPNPNGQNVPNGTFHVEQDEGAEQEQEQEQEQEGRGTLCR